MRYFIQLKQNGEYFGVALNKGTLTLKKFNILKKIDM